MKTAKFNLELAIAGHPLITNEGNKVTDFKYFKDINSIYKVVAVTDGNVMWCTPEGGDWEGVGILLLDKSIPWEPELKIGDEIEVNLGGMWIKRIFITHGKNNSVIVVTNEDKGGYLNGECFQTTRYTEYRRISKNAELDIKITCNGADIKLSDISEETLINLRNKCK